MNYVFDSSFVAALVIPDEKNQYVDKLYAKILNDDEKHTPHLFWHEIANIFMGLIRRKRYSHDEVIQFIPRVAAFRLITDFETGGMYCEKLLRLCNDYNLSSYDAAYLELAERKKAVLCTLDENLKKAAKKYGVITVK